MESYQVVKRCADSGAFVAVVAGLGRNKGTWDATHSKATAKRHAKVLNSTALVGIVYTVESSCGE